MILFKQAAGIQDFLTRKRAEGLRTGYVPTMGALHAGHLSLIETSKKNSGLTICSIFVNPTQFNDPSDFEHYPSTIEQDIYALEKAGCDVLFLPPVKEIYPDGTAAAPSYTIGYLDTILEGRYRPGHFQGVCQVVDRLLEIVHPDDLYLGQKDYQQCMVVKELIRQTNKSVVLHICSTLREKNGLAMSSRNMRLSPAEKEQAAELFKTLNVIKSALKKGDLSSLLKEASSRLEAKGFDVDYVEIAQAQTLEPVSDWDGATPLVALVAAFLGKVRLIDNLLL